MKDIFFISSDLASVFFNILVILFLFISFEKNKRYIPFLSFIIYTLILLLVQVNYDEGSNLNKLISALLFLFYISQSSTRKLNYKRLKIVYIFVLLLFLPHVGILCLYNPAYTRLSYFAFATLGFVLLYIPNYFVHNKMIVFIMFIINVMSLAKWLAIYYIKNLLYFLKAQKITPKILVKWIAVLIIGYYILNLSAVKGGYESIDHFISRRVTKTYLQEDSHHTILGISDGSRVEIALSQVSDLVKSKDISGLGLSYMNKLNVGEHNYFLFLITRFGLIGIFIMIIFIVNLIKSMKINRGFPLLYLHIILVFMIGEYYGNPLAIFSIIITHYLLSHRKNEEYQ